MPNSAVSIIPLRSIRAELAEVEQLLLEAIAAANEPLRAALEPHLMGGKRLRAGLVLLTGSLFSAPSLPLQRLAAAIELLHAATLVHDDIIDQSDLRRGNPTLHTIWPTSVAILAGDFLLAQSVALVAELQNPRILRSLADGLRRVSAGEIRETLGSTGVVQGKQEYYLGTEAKTAALFAASAAMAAMVAGAVDSTVATLASFGRELGMAFQVVDDVLDISADEVTLGKPAGSDLRQGLVTLPVLLFLEQHRNTEVVTRVLEGQRGEPAIKAAVDAIRGSGSVEMAMDEARGFADRARSILAGFPDGVARGELYAMVDYVVTRPA